MHSIDYTIIGIYLVFIFCFGLWAGRHVKNVKEYAVAHQSYGAFVLFATLSASFIGGGFSFGNADTVFNQGLMSAAALWGFSLMLLLVSKFITPHVESFRNCISVGDILARKLGIEVRFLSGLLGCLVCTGIFAAQIGAIGAVFTQFTPLTFGQGVFIGCGIVIAYTSFGGINAVVLTDVVQFLLLVVCIPLALFMGIHALGGIEEFTAKLPPKFLALPTGLNGWVGWAGLFLTFLIGETLVPPYVQRLLIAKDITATRRGTFYSGILSIPFFIITGLIGVVAFMFDPHISSNLAMPTVVGKVLPMGLKGLACAAIISIVMSSADSFLNAASVSFIEDIVKPLVQRTREKDLSVKNYLFLTKMISLLIGCGAIVVALKIQNVLDVLKFAYNFWAPVMLVPLVFVLLEKRVSKRAFWYAAVTGACLVLVLFACGGGQLFNINAAVLATLGSAVVFIYQNRKDC